MYVVLRVSYPLFLSGFDQTWILSTYFGKNAQVSNLMRIRPVTAELFHADGQTDRHDEANNSFSQFYERI